MVTSLIKAKNVLYSVKTSSPVPKEKIFDVLNEIALVKTDNTELSIGDVIVENILNTGSNVVVTGKNNL